MLSETSDDDGESDDGRQMLAKSTLSERTSNRAMVLSLSPPSAQACAGAMERRAPKGWGFWAGAGLWNVVGPAVNQKMLGPPCGGPT